ncbi:alpha-hydroxy-acid oxidizing protein [Streptomyces sp. NPDC001586]|uniref:alpha-hydroxy-acid oxidizing protein n=1 Tax=Streptomyces sp. NPDC001586 TaxID=3154387 RepID=UPI0033238EC9
MALSGSSLEESARAMLPPGAYDFNAAGSGEELSRDEAADAWRSYRFLPRVLRDVSRVDSGIELLGERLNSPVRAAPTAFHAMAHPEGDIATAQGVGDAGQLRILSSRATSPVEGAGPWWFQVYVLRDREITARQVQRVVAAGARALVLTVDAPYVAAKPRVTRPLPLPREAHAPAVGVDTRTADWEALGADAVLIGRPIRWALAVRGRAGVRSLLDSYRTELAEAMALVGARSPEEIGFDLLAPGNGHPAR